MFALPTRPAWLAATTNAPVDPIAVATASYSRRSTLIVSTRMMNIAFAASIVATGHPVGGDNDVDVLDTHPLDDRGQHVDLGQVTEDVR